MNHLTAIKIPADRPWLPPSIRHQALKGEVPIEVKFSHAERRVYRKRKRVPVSVWAENHRMLTMSSLPGKWRNSTTPYLAGIMDAAIAPGVEEVVICKAPQVGVSEAAHNFIGWCIDRAPGPVMYVYPDELTADENSRDRIVPMIMSSPRLRSYLTGAQDDSGLKRINLAHMPIYLAWARSASRLGNKPIRYLILDEVDKYPATAGKKESDPISLAEKRTTTYKWQRKIWKISTPTDENGAIVKAIGLCAVVFVFEVCCPLCGGAQVMNFDNIIWPKDERDPNQIEMNRLANYKCKHCEELWNDDDRNRAVGTGSWICKDTSRQLEAVLRTRPKRIGFHLPAWLSRFVSLSETAASFLRGLKDPIKMRDFCNAHKAEPWVEEQSEGIDVKILQERREDYGPEVPEAAAVLTCGVDVQGDRLEIEVIAHGVDDEDWGMDYHVITGDTSLPAVWAKLDEYLQQPWRHALGADLKIAACLVDSGYRSKEVYNFVRGKYLRRIVATKGYSVSGKPLITGPSKQRFGNSRIHLISIGTDTGKDTLFSHLAIEEYGPGFCHFPNHYPDYYFQHFAAERCYTKIVKGVATHEWRKTNNNARNEAIDLRVLNMAAKAFLNPNIPKILDDLQRKAEPVKPIEEPSFADQVRRSRSRSGKKGFVNNWRR